MKLGTIAAGLIVVTLCVASSATADPVWPIGWHCRQQVTVSALGNSSTLSDFPVLVKLTDQANPLFTRALSNGNDILFTDSNGTKLDHEIEYYQNSGTKELDAWIRVPSLPSGGTTLYMFYQNPGAANQQNAGGVWDANYKMVQHLEETGASTGVLADSISSPKNNATPYNGATITSLRTDNGRIDGGVSLDGTNDYVLVQQDGRLTFGSGDFSVEIWANANVLGSKYDGLISTDTTGDLAWKIVREANASYYRAKFNGTVVDYPAVTTGAWHEYAFVKEGTTLSVYFDGNFTASKTCPATHPVTTNELVFGSYRINDAKNAYWIFNGLMDEVRISGGVRSADWLKASYQSVTSSVTFGAEVVPEPSTIALAVLGGLGLTCRLVRRRKR